MGGWHSVYVVSSRCWVRLGYAENMYATRMLACMIIGMHMYFYLRHYTCVFTCFMNMRFRRIFSARQPHTQLRTDVRSDLLARLGYVHEC